MTSLFLTCAAQSHTPHIYTPSFYLHVFVICSPYFFKLSLFLTVWSDVGTCLCGVKQKPSLFYDLANQNQAVYPSPRPKRILNKRARTRTDWLLCNLCCDSLRSKQTRRRIRRRAWLCRWHLVLSDQYIPEQRQPSMPPSMTRMRKMMRRRRWRRVR